MPKKNDKKVILVSGGSSNWYEQAIFIVKDKKSRLPIDIVKEAENIIKKYPGTFAYISAVNETVGNFKTIKNSKKEK